jgi:hypothetical protein
MMIQIAALFFLVGVSCWARTKLVVATSSLANADPGVSYSAQLQARGGRAPYTWSLRRGTLPVGLVLAASGLITGQTASAQTTATFSVTVRDSAGATATGNESIAVANVLQMSATLPASCTQLVVGVPVNCVLPVSGGWPPYTCSITAGSIPIGLTLNGCTITGTPAVVVTTGAMRVAPAPSLAMKQQTAARPNGPVSKPSSVGQASIAQSSTPTPPIAAPASKPSLIRRFFNWFK